MSETISSEVPAVVTVTSQPVSCSYAVTQSYAGIGAAVLDVAGPGHDRQRPFALTDLGQGVAAVSGGVVIVIISASCGDERQDRDQGHEPS